jgi:hypothetical protein
MKEENEKQYSRSNTNNISKENIWNITKRMLKGRKGTAKLSNHSTLPKESVGDNTRRNTIDFYVLLENFFEFHRNSRH